MQVGGGKGQAVIQGGAALEPPLRYIDIGEFAFCGTMIGRLCPGGLGNGSENGSFD